MNAWRKSQIGQGGAAPMPLASAGPAPGPARTAAAPSGDSMATLINSESGGNWQAQNNAVGAGGQRGHYGRLQFGHARLEDAKRAGVIPQDVTPQQFMANPEMQKAVEAWHFADIDNRIATGPASRAIGTSINGVPVTPEGLRAVAHLGGVGGMNRFVESGGQYNPADVNGTSLMDYMRRHGGAAPAPTQVAQAPGVPPGPVASDAPPMAYAPGPQAISAAMPQTGPVPPPAPRGQQLTNTLAAPPPPPQATGGNPGAALLAAAMSPGVSPRLQAQAMQMYGLTQREQPKWEKLNDGTLYNPRTAETRAVGGGFRPLTDPAERARFGIPSDDRTPYYVGPDGKPARLGGSQTTVNIDNKTETAADTEAAKALIKRYATAVEAGDKANAAMVDINTMREISRRVGSIGASADVKAAIGPYAEALGIKIDDLDDIQAFEAVIQRLAPQMRAEGSGSTSDIEFKGMLASLPRLRNNPQAREMILDTMEANARYNMQRGDIAMRVLTKEINRNDAEKEIKALGDPMAAFRAFRKANPDLFKGQPAAQAPASQPGQQPTRRTVGGKTYEKRGNDWFEVQ